MTDDLERRLLQAQIDLLEAQRLYIVKATDLLPEDPQRQAKANRMLRHMGLGKFIIKNDDGTPIIERDVDGLIIEPGSDPLA